MGRHREPTIVARRLITERLALGMLQREPLDDSISIEVSGEHDNSLSLAEIAYLAGLIDGEGTIGIYRQGRTKTDSLTLSSRTPRRPSLNGCGHVFGGGTAWRARSRPWHRPLWQRFIRSALHQ